MPRSPSPSTEDPELSPGDDDEGEEYLTSDNPIPSDKYPALKARVLGRIHFPFRNFFVLIEAGMEWDRATEETQQAIPDDSAVRGYIDLLNMAPLLRDCIDERQDDLLELANELDLGRRKARAADISSLKKHMHIWDDVFKTGAFKPTPRTALGFNNDTIGEQLCPPSHDWNDLRIREKIRSGGLKIDPEDLPRFLWADPNDDDWDSFMKGPIVLKTVRHIFIGPTAGEDHNLSGVPSMSGNRKGNAKIHGIRRMTIYGLAYAAMLARFVLSSQLTFNAEPCSDSEFPHKLFYKHLINLMSEEMSKEERDALLIWYDERVFGNDRDNADEPGGMVAGVKRGSMVERMKASAKARRGV
ncbi:hypothetical protein BDN72DRAFT_966222 [Pluteus cervinus]|uniref:Uncharacterized protein n=1 Tax=Pluteus cervinus TaxID=181527 RepID=A0ACD2ZZP6_9AGAR|nr:hypothetical protein BDN72DRAFT_966222 [Pluteus cervinus]